MLQLNVCMHVWMCACVYVSDIRFLLKCAKIIFWTSFTKFYWKIYLWGIVFFIEDNLAKKEYFWRRDIFWQLRINRAEKIRKNFLLQYFGWQKNCCSHRGAAQLFLTVACTCYERGDRESEWEFLIECLLILSM